MKEKNVICLSYIKLFILIVPLLGPEGLKTLSPVTYCVFFKIFKLLDLSFIIFLFIRKYLKHKKVSPFLVLFLVMIGINVGLTVLYHGAVYECLNVYICSVGMIMLLNLYEEDIYKVLDVAFFYLSFLLIANLFFILLFPKGMYHSGGPESYTLNWLLGYKSSLQYYALPAYCLGMIRIKNNIGKLVESAVIIVCHLSAVLADNRMLIVGLLLLDIIFLTRMNQLYNIFNAAFYGVAAVGANITLLLFPYNNIHIISFILTDKNLENSRGRMWNVTMEWIKKSWMIGYGNTQSSIRYEMYGRWPHSHNQILELLFQGGVVLLIAYIILNIYVIWNLMKHRSRATAQVLAACIFSLYIMTCVEIFTRYIGTMLWLLFALSEYIPQIEEQYDRLRSTLRKKT